MRCSYFATRRRDRLALCTAAASPDPTAVMLIDDLAEAATGCGGPHPDIMKPRFRLRVMGLQQNMMKAASTTSPPYIFKMPTDMLVDLAALISRSTSNSLRCLAMTSGDFLTKPFSRNNL
eukprot:CAMPEP_0119546206 /NCGR_PEP_ID=MMETSP1352-20130426/719_1 /TAXON_ID=265584 /ORGANISM="Stauroneis constricta, Strain CCMP1120" /LENGTH=119 /DNA_ID=CAMNT_0007590879 /DNA_START=574 /DNA_END=933 /DNA_ORIENTATION=-